MSGSTVHPRFDHIDELTRGIRLPLPAIEDVHIQVLAEGLCDAFDETRLGHPAIVASGDEPDVTALIESCLVRMIDENVLWGQLVDCVVRGKESMSFDGSHLEKRPDLSIYLSDRTRRFPLVVEAKIVDAAHAKTVASYCDRGLLRFVEGEYAWANREAFMIGYVRDKSSIDAKLIPFLANANVLNPAKYLVEEYAVDVGPAAVEFAYTRHGRNFVYSRQVPPNSPGAILVWHLWLS